MPLSFSFLQFFSQRVIGSWEWLQASRPLPADHLALPQSFLSYSLWAQAKGHWLRPGLRFLGGLWNFLETDWAVSAAHSLEQSEQRYMAGRSFEPLSLPEACGFKALIAEIRATPFQCSARKGHASLVQVMAAPSRGPQPGLEKRWLQGPGASCGACVSLPIKSSLCSEGRSTCPSLQLCLWCLSKLQCFLKLRDPAARGPLFGVSGMTFQMIRPHLQGLSFAGI